MPNVATAMRSALQADVWSHPALWPRLRSQRWRLPLVALLGFLASGLEGIGIGLFIPLVTAGGQLPAWARTWFSFWPAVKTAPLWASAALLLILVLVRAAVQVLSERVIAKVHCQVAHDIRGALVDALLRCPYAFFLKHDPNRLLALIHSESFRVADLVLQALRLSTTLCASVALLCLLLFFGHGLIVPVLIGVAILRLMQRGLETRLRRLSVRSTEESRLVLARAATIALSARTWSLFGQGAAEGRRFERQSRRLATALQALQYARLWATPLQEVGAAVLFLAVALLASAEQMSPAALVTFLALLYRLQPYLRSSQLTLATMASYRGSVQEVAWLLSQSAATPRLLPAQEESCGTGDITFDCVSYTYPGEDRLRPVLHAVNLRIPVGQAAALLGHSGAGKSTVVQLLTGLLLPDEGSIAIGGRPLSPATHARFRESLSVAGQDVDLVDGSIAHNIAYGCEGLPHSAIEQAARSADAHAFICALPQAYATMVGSRGRALSVGQRQRIGLARALAHAEFHAATMLILDEATAAVDGPSEEAIIGVLHNLPMTKLVIGHRRAVLAQCTWAIVLADGRVVEQGPLADCAYFRDMVS